MKRGYRLCNRGIFGVAFALSCAWAAHASLGTVEGSAAAREKPATATAADAEAVGQNPDALDGTVKTRLARKGVVVDFQVEPLHGATELREAEYAKLSFRLSDATTGTPLSSLYPAAWMDLDRPLPGATRAEPLGCKDQVGRYLQGSVSFRPAIDLNAYYVLALNDGPSISVIDPIVGIAGITQMYAMTILKRPGADWAKTRDDERLFVTVPRTNEVAVVDTGSFKVDKYVAAGDKPIRAALQPDDRYLWVGNDSEDLDASGVTVIDTVTLSVAAHIPTGKGHHEIAFSDDSRYAFVTNQGRGSVTVIDVRDLRKVKDLQIGTLPTAMAYSPLSKALYVVDGEDGTISVVDTRRHEIITRIEAKPGLSAIGFTPDGRWGVVLNIREDAALVLDASTNRVAHSVKTAPRPFQLTFTTNFAYVRALGTERVTMIPVGQMGSDGELPVTTFPAGTAPPEWAKSAGIAESMVPAPTDGAVIVANPADNGIYYYVEGMVAPMGSFRNYGHRVRAVQVVNRSLQEQETGVYSTTVKIPAAGDYDVAFLLDSPSIIHCFKLTAAKNPMLPQKKQAALRLEYLLEGEDIESGEATTLRFRLTDPLTDKPRLGLQDVRVRYLLAPGTWHRREWARHVGDGIYEVDLLAPRPGLYYVNVECPSLKVGVRELPGLTLRARSSQDKGKGGRASPDAESSANVAQN